MDKFRCQFLKTSWVRRAQGLRYQKKKFWSLKGFFLKCGVSVKLKNIGVLLSGIGRGKEFLFSRSYFLGGKK